MPLWPTGNFRVVLRQGDGSKAGCLVSFPAVVTANRWIVPDSGYGVADSFGSRSRGRAVAVSDVFRGGSHSRAAATRYDSWSCCEWSTLLDAAQI